MTGRNILCAAAVVLGLGVALVASQVQAQDYYGYGNNFSGGQYGAYPNLPNPMVYPWAYGAYGGHHVSYEGFKSNYGGGVLRYPNNGLSTYGPYSYNRPASYYSQGNMGGYGAGAGCNCQ